MAEATWKHYLSDYNEGRLDISTAVIIVGLFFAGELVLSRLLFRLNIRDRPY